MHHIDTVKLERMADTDRVLTTSEYDSSATKRISYAHEKLPDASLNGMGAGRNKGKFEGKAKGKGLFAFPT
eukprot:8987353-Pyramimonas_sp.AAC.1